MSQNEQEHEMQDAGLGGRYASSVGWEPKRDRMSEREMAAARKKAREEFRVKQALELAIEVRPVRDWLSDAPEPGKKAELFGPFWREGELAVLTGVSGVGKSVLAMQVAAEAGASAMHNAQCTMQNSGEDTGGELSIVDCPSSISVLYFELERTERQLRERYSDGRREYEFSEGLEMGLLADVATPGSYKGRRERFLRDAIMTKLVDGNPRVAIVDNVSWLLRSQSPSEVGAMMKTFRRWVNDSGNSLLLVMHTTEKEEALHAGKGLALADTIVSMRQSMMGRAFRYLKLIRSSNADSAENVWGYELVRSPAPKPLMTVADARKNVEDTPTPFLGFLHLGEVPEEIHTFDYRAQCEISRQAVARAEERLKHRPRLVRPPVPELGESPAVKRLNMGTTLVDVGEGE